MLYMGCREVGNGTKARVRVRGCPSSTRVAGPLAVGLEMRSAPISNRNKMTIWLTLYHIRVIVSGIEIPYLCRRFARSGSANKV